MKDYEVKTPITQFDEIRGFEKVSADALCKSCGAKVYYPPDIDSERRKKAKQRIRETADTGDCLACGAKIYEQGTGTRKSTEDPVHKLIKRLAVIQAHLEWPEETYPDCEVPIVLPFGELIKVDAVLFIKSGPPHLAIEVENENPVREDKIFCLHRNYIPVILKNEDLTPRRVDIGAGVERGKEKIRNVHRQDVGDSVTHDGVMVTITDAKVIGSRQSFIEYHLKAENVESGQNGWSLTSDDILMSYRGVGMSYDSSPSKFLFSDGSNEDTQYGWIAHQVQVPDPDLTKTIIKIKLGDKRFEWNLK